MIDKYANESFDYVGEIIINTSNDEVVNSNIDIVIKYGEINKE
jgi:hypothetical protein